MGRGRDLDGDAAVTAFTSASGEEETRRRQRWRLALGAEATPQLGALSGEAAQQEAVLAFLEGGGGQDPGPGSREGTGLMTVPDWINRVHTLFPRSVADRIVDDAVNRYGMTDVVTDPDALARATPNVSLLKAILSTKHLMNPEVLAMARSIIDTVVRDLMRTLARPVTNPFTGRRDPLRRSRRPVAANFDARGTVRANLKHVDPRTRRLVIREPLFNTRVRLLQQRWQVVVLVDQSGSMAESVIHAAITAAIFSAISSMRTHLVAFDTEVVDLTGEIGDPVEVLMRVQLGGGTRIDKAMQYAEQVLDNPRRSIVVLISDFFEGGTEQTLVATTARMVEAGVTVLCLGALDAFGRANYNQVLGRILAGVGAQVAVMTPDQLAEWVAEVIG